MIQVWTNKDIEILVELYSTTDNKVLCKMLNKTVTQVYNKSFALGLKKTKEYKKEFGKQFRTGNPSTYFKKGQTAWNKGMKGLQIGGKETQFRKGHTPHNNKPIGHRSLRDGYLVERTDKGFEFVHVMLWKKHNGEIPKGMFVVFKDRNKNNINIDNLEIIDRAENMRRNHVQNLPKELLEVIQVKKSLTRKINSYGKKQN